MTNPADGDFDENDEIGDFGTNEDNLEGLARRAISRLNAEARDEIDVNDYPEIEELVMLLHDSIESNANSSLKGPFGFQTSVINKFRNFKGSVHREVALKIAESFLSYLRSNIDWREGDTAPPQSSSQAKAPAPPPRITVKAMEWLFVVRTPDIDANIDELIRLLREVMERATTTNLASGDRALTDAERAQLIAVLETAIQILKAPMMEKGLLKKAKEAMEKGALSAIEKGVEHAFSFSAGFAAGKLSDFIGHSF